MLRGLSLLRALPRGLVKPHGQRPLSSSSSSSSSSPSSSSFAGVRGVLTSSEALAALRPFYLAVHPDLLSHYPTEKAANEEALKWLHSYLESLTSTPHYLSPPPPHLQFFLLRRDGNSSGKGTLKCVQVPLPMIRSVGHTVHAILHSCHLLSHLTPTARGRLLTDHIPTPAVRTPISERGKGRSFTAVDPEDWESMFADHSRYKSRPLLLNEWLNEYAPIARAANERSEPIRRENERRIEDLCALFGVGDICGSGRWTAATLRGYLLGLGSALGEAGEVWGEVVEVWRRGRVRVRVGRVRNWGSEEEGVKALERGEGGPVLMVGHTRGVDICGQIHLDCQDTPQQWTKYLHSLREPLLLLHEVCSLEETIMDSVSGVSGVSGISSVSGVSIQRNVSVSLSNYHMWLRRMVGEWGGRRWRRREEEEKGRRERREEDDDCNVLLEITRPRCSHEEGRPCLRGDGVVEVPASCPRHWLIVFLHTHQHQIHSRRAEHRRLCLSVNKSLQNCRHSLSLSSISAHSSLTAPQVLRASGSLSRAAHRTGSSSLAGQLTGLEVCVGVAYLVSGDGELTIPWDFQFSGE